MLDENITRFAANKDAALKLIQMDRNGSMDKIAKKARQDGKISFNENSNDTKSVPINNVNNNTEYTLKSTTNSKLPKAILDSFNEHQINPYGVENKSSILDVIEEKSTKPLFVNESNNILEKNNNQPIDYQMIKMIVESCIKDQLKEMKKEMITESITNSDNVKIVKFGNKFNFITSNGDLYEASLKYIKNIKK